MHIKYKHTEEVHNFKAPKEVVPLIMELVKPSSVVDVGCGLGTWLKEFLNYGVESILGIDGVYVERKKMKIPEKFFLAKNLDEPLNIIRKYDLVISLEVAEHLKESSAEKFIETLTKLGDTILFSAAIKAQGGQNHINEQNPKYWINKFNQNGYDLYDILRPIFWNNKNVDWWYRQNMMIFTKNKIIASKLENLDSFFGQNLVHPVLFQNRSLELDSLRKEKLRIERGYKFISYYLSLLRKALLTKIK